jgi:hypothetical protein
MKYTVLFFTILLSQFTGFSQNVVIGNIGSQNEPSIMFDPVNPNRVVAGSNLNFSHYSSDGGVTWVTKAIKSDYGVWGDPTIVVDTNGHFYFFHLSNPPSGNGNWIDRIVCQKSTDSGAR